MRSCVCYHSSKTFLISQINNCVGLASQKKKKKNLPNSH